MRKSSPNIKFISFNKNKRQKSNEREIPIEEMLREEIEANEVKTSAKQDNSTNFNQAELITNQIQNL